MTVADEVTRISIRELRRALGDDPQKPRFIETVHGRGYLFIAEVEFREAVPDTPADPPPRTEIVRSLVGRDDSLAALRAHFAKAERGERQIVFVSGEVGIGKTTLVDTFVGETLQRANGSGANRAAGKLLIGRGQCVEQFGASDPYMPFLEAIAQICRGDGADDAAAILRRAPVPWLARILHLSPDAEGPSVSVAEDAFTHERILRLMAETLEALSADITVVLNLEDLHWSDTSSIDLLNVLAQRRGPARLMIIGTLRRTEAIAGHNPLHTVIRELYRKGFCAGIDVEALDEKAVGELLRQHCPGVDVTESLIRLVFQQSGGNPFFMITLVDHLREHQLLDTVARGSRVDVGVPESLREMIEAHLDELDPDEIELLGVASVVGVDFEAQPLAAALAETDIERVEDCCETMVRRRLFLSPAGESQWPDGSCGARYSFEHAIYRQVVYGRLTPNRRRRLHRQIGERLQSGYGGRSAEVAPALAEHFERGGDTEKAIAFQLQAARSAKERASTQVAVRHYEDALRLTEALPESIEVATRQIEILLELGEAKMAVLMPEMGEVYTRMAEVAERWNFPVASVIAAGGIFTAHVMRAELGPARECAERFLKRQDDVPLPIEASGNVALGSTLFNCGELSEARVCLEQAKSSLANREEEIFKVDSGSAPGFLGVLGAGHYALVLAMQGHIDEARVVADGVSAIAVDFNSPRNRAHAACLVAQLHAILADRESVRPAAARMLEVATEFGLPGFRAEGEFLVAWAEGGREALAVMREALESRFAVGQIVGHSLFQSLLAEDLLRHEDVAAARRLVDEGFAYAEKTGELRHVSDLHRLAGECSAREGDRKQAAESYRRALEVARQQGARLCELRALSALARLPAERRRQRQRLAETCEWFGDTVQSVDLAEARLLLSPAGADYS